MGTFSGPSTKVNRQIVSGTTVNANCYAMVTYIPTGFSGGISSTSRVAITPEPITRYFGPGQNIPNNFTSPVYLLNSATPPYFDTAQVTYTVLSGVEMINSNI